VTACPLNVTEARACWAVFRLQGGRQLASMTPKGSGFGGFKGTALRPVGGERKQSEE
jgi:hypothetical protein